MKKIIISLLILLNITLHAQEMEMTDTNGESYKVQVQGDQFEIEGMKGKVVFLEFFGLRCPACRELMPTLIKLQDKYPNKLRIMAIEVQNNDIDPINNYKEEHHINYTTFSNYDIGLVVRYMADNAEWAGAIPFLAVIDTKGKVQVLKVGLSSEKTLEDYIEKYSK
ncbi:MAG: Thioredoxin [uncultured Sulfurovum sp.]|uniref:Thioredoxin n=1 Tax=uncultured Sulfurovum sp. TaxID=269237 RepID=A0A6S6TTL6_9BACT|nr:MAG: Thioredoxin [uncultured Sulfurovum sp.]